MRLICGLTAAALPGLALGASQPGADVYMLQPSSLSSSSSADRPQVLREVARHIMLQRTSRQRYGSDLRDIPSSVDAETAVGHIATFGKPSAPLFAKSESHDAAQLVVILEGVADEQSRQLGERLGQRAVFTISDPPSARANDRLMGLFENIGVASSRQCDLPAAINPFDTDCWSGPSSVVKYDLQRSPKTLDSLLDNLPRINNFVTSGDLEVLLVLLPESSRSSKHNHWSAAAAGAGSASDLRRRAETEAVISDQADDDLGPSTKRPATTRPAAAAAAAATSSSNNPSSPLRTKPIPQCFTSLSACQSQTNSCSGHGECVNKYATGGGKNGTAPSSAAAASCFACVCKATVVEHAKGRKTVHWGGSTCQKEDISVQFWLIAGFTVVIVGAITFAIGLLFSVGEEQLPGVIGAGVSRSK